MKVGNVIPAKVVRVWFENDVDDRCYMRVHPRLWYKSTETGFNTIDEDQIPELESAFQVHMQAD